MKKIAFTFLLLTLVILNSCNKELNTYTVGIAVNSSFDQDSVQVFIDKEQVINKRLQTNYVIGYAGGASTTRNEGIHETKVILNNILTKKEHFLLTDTLNIGINYNREKNEISFMYSNQPFAYD